MIPNICLSCIKATQSYEAERTGICVCSDSVMKKEFIQGITTNVTSCPEYVDAKRELLTFNAKQIELVVGGKKTCTMRRLPHGKVGDTFRAAGELYEITKISGALFVTEAIDYYEKEGYVSKMEFLNDFTEIYKPTPNAVFFAHEFVKVS